MYIYSYPDELRMSSITIGVYHILVFFRHNRLLATSLNNANIKCL